MIATRTGWDKPKRLWENPSTAPTPAPTIAMIRMARRTSRTVTPLPIDSLLVGIRKMAAERLLAERPFEVPELFVDFVRVRDRFGDGRPQLGAEGLAQPMHRDLHRSLGGS